LLSFSSSPPRLNIQLGCHSILPKLSESVKLSVLFFSIFFSILDMLIFSISCFIFSFSNIGYSPLNVSTLFGSGFFISSPKFSSENPLTFWIFLFILALNCGIIESLKLSVSMSVLSIGLNARVCVSNRLYPISSFEYLPKFKFKFLFSDIFVRFSISSSFFMLCSSEKFEYDSFPSSVVFACSFGVFFGVQLMVTFPFVFDRNFPSFVVFEDVLIPPLIVYDFSLFGVLLTLLSNISSGSSPKLMALSNVFVFLIGIVLIFCVFDFF